jgi:phage baseplate assembly protein gpV
MMDSIVGVMKKIAEHEAQKIYTTELGLVTATFPHRLEQDGENYQCSVKLKNKKQPDGSDFELRQVPVATPHLGLVNIPNVGDLVLVTFIAGDIHAPIIIGRLYNAEDQPPVNQGEEFLLQRGLAGGGHLKFDAEGVITATSPSGKNTVKVSDKTITLKNNQCRVAVSGNTVKIASGGGEDAKSVTVNQEGIEVNNGTCTIKVTEEGITIDALASNITINSMGAIQIGDAVTASVKVGGRGQPGNAVADGDTLMLSTHQHVGNLGVPCPILVPVETVNSIQAKTRNTQVG